MNKLIAYAALVAAFFLIGAAPTHAAVHEAPLPPQQLTEEQAGLIYAVAYGQYHGPPEWLQMMPDIHVVLQATLCQAAGVADDCRIEGRFAEGNVYLLNTLDFSDVVAATVLLHEFVHHFQTLKHGPVKDCQDWLDREHEAYAIQSVVLLNAGKVMEAMDVRKRARQWRCASGQNSMGKAFRCEEEGASPSNWMRDAEYQFPTINLLTYRDKLVLPWLKECVAESKPIRECVINKCTATGME